MVDVDLPKSGGPIPSDENHFHYGKAQTDAELDLPPGEHKLRLLFAQGNHFPYDPAITDTITVENCTVFANLDNGLDQAAGTTFLVTNTISVANVDLDFDMTTGTQSNNVSSDGTASGPGSLPFRSATINPSPGAGDWVIFTSIAAGTEDLHLQASVVPAAWSRPLSRSATTTAFWSGWRCTG